MLETDISSILKNETKDQFYILYSEANCVNGLLVYYTFGTTVHTSLTSFVHPWV